MLSVPSRLPTQPGSTTQPTSPAVVVEIRPGEGGIDAEVFAGELAQAFMTYVRRRGGEAALASGRTTTVSVISSPRLATELDRELTRFSGVHRIQRIPPNERSGRRHTSTATVAVLDANMAPAPVEIDDTEVEITTKRGTGKGGQHRNVTDSAVRLVHRPTGIVVEVNHGRSQGQNIASARAELERRLARRAAQAQRTERNQVRSSQISSGERPVKAFTWNDQRGEVIDHMSGSRFSMQAFLRGHLELALSD